MSNVISTGSSVTISSGQSSGGLDIRIFDLLTVLSGGTVSASSINGEGLTNVGGTGSNGSSPGGAPPGSAFIYGTAIGNDILSNGVETIYAGGIASGNTVDVSGFEEVAGGTVISDTVGGRIDVSSGGTTTGTNDHGFEYVSSGGSVLNTSVTVGLFGGGEEIILAGGNATGTVLQSQGLQTVAGAASLTTVSGGGVEEVESGGTTTSTTILSGGVGIASGGAVASATTISSGGVLVVLPGGQAVNTNEMPGGLIISAGVFIIDPLTTPVYSNFGALATAVTVGISAQEYVLAGGATLSGLVKDQGATLIADGGQAVSNTIQSGGTQILSSGGTASFSQIAGSDTIASGGVELSATVAGSLRAPGTMAVSAGGEAISTTVLIFGSQTISSGGIASGAVLSGGVYNYSTTTGTAQATSLGTEVVSAGGSATNVTVGIDGKIVDSGTVTGLLVMSSGIAEIGSGAVTTGTVLNGGLEIVDVGATVSQTLVSGIFYAGSETVYGSSVSATITPHGRQFVYGQTLDTVVISAVGAGTVYIESGGVATATTVQNGGDQIVMHGGTASGTLLLQGNQSVSGTARGTIVLGGREDVTSGGVTTGTTVSALNGNQYVFSAGTASGTTLIGHAEQSVEQGLAVSTIVSSGATQLVNLGEALGTIVSSGGRLEIGGGSSVSAVISAGGREDIGLGSAVSTTVFSGGIANFVSSTTVVDNITVSSGGFALMSSGATLTGGIVSSGGVLEALSGEPLTIFTNLTIASGGAIALGGIVVGPGAPVTVPGVQAVDTIFSGVLVQAGGAIDYVSALVSGGTLSVGSGGAVFAPTLSAGATLDIASGGAVYNPQGAGGPVTLNDDGTVAFTSSGYFSGTIAGSGNVVDTASGTLTLTGQNTVGGTITVSNGGTLDLTNALAAGSATLNFTGDPGLILEFATPAGAFTNPISGLAAGDTILLTTLAYVSGATTAILTGNTLAVTAGTTTYDLTIDGLPAADSFVASSEPNGTTLLTVTACYCTGTRILTTLGEVPVETLRIGDHVVTASGAVRPIRWLGHRTYRARFIAGNPAAHPVRIAAGALGQGLPRRDLFVSPEHAMLIDGVLVPAHLLVGAPGVTQPRATQDVSYWHVELDSHDAILAEGAPSETFLDDGSRGMFHNAADYARRYPDAAAPSGYCAPRVESGYHLEAIRRRLAA